MRMSRKRVERKGYGAGNVFFLSFSIFLFLFLMWRGEWRRGCRLVMWSGQRWQPWHPCHSSTSSQCNQEQYALSTHCANKSRSEKCPLQGNWLAMSSLDKDLQFLSVCHHKAKPNCSTKLYLMTSFTLKHLNPGNFILVSAKICDKDFFVQTKNCCKIFWAFKRKPVIQSVNILGRIEYVVGGVGALDVPTGGLAMHPTICSLVTMYKVEKENMMMTATSI